MATKEGKSWWNPYETSNKRQFTYHPQPSAEIVLGPGSTSFICSHSRSGPFGSTLYKKDFCWKPVCKPECIRTGTATGQRRNNPHPSQSFMMWRRPRDAARGSECAGFPWKSPPSEGEIRKALTAQYCSTYRCDFMGLPQGKRLVPLHSRHEESLPADTGRQDKYSQAKQKPELLGGRSLHCYNSDPNTTRGIVPTVVPRHMSTQQKISNLTNYDRFCGKRLTDVTRVIKSLLPQELQQLHRILPEEGKEALQLVLSREAPHSSEGMDTLPAVALNSCTPEWISRWPGPH